VPVGGEDVIEHRDIGELPEAAPAPGMPVVGRNLIAVIGIDRYAHWPSLHNAVSDAQGVLAAFQRLGFEPVAPPLLDDAATDRAIDALVTDDLATLSPHDRLVVFFAGHGGTREQLVGSTTVKTGYLIPVDGDASPKHAVSWIDIDHFLTRISQLPPLHSLVIHDRCHAGIALSRKIHWGRGSDHALGTPLAAHRRRSRVVIASALDDERAMDNGPVAGHSLFTGCLVEALAGGMPGVQMSDGRRVAGSAELGSYLRQRVQGYAGVPGWQQTPDYGTLDYDDRGDMPIPLLLEDDAAIRLPEPPAGLAAGSVRTMLAATPELLSASEPAFTASWLAQDGPADDVLLDDGPGPRDRPSSPRLMRPPSIADHPRERPLSPRLRPPSVADLTPPPAAEASARSSIQPAGCLIAASVSVALVVIAVLGVRALLRAPAAAVAVIDLGEEAGVPEPGADKAASFELEPPPSAMHVRRAGGSPPPIPAPPPGPMTDRSPVPDDDLPETPRASFRPTVQPDAVQPNAAQPNAAQPDAATSASGMRRAAKQQDAAALHPHDCFALVNVTPSGADILRGDVVIEKTRKDLVLLLPCGETTLTFRKPYHGGVTRTLVAALGGTQLNSHLRPITDSMTVSSSPRGATILLGGKQLGVTPATVKIPAGDQATLVITKDGYAPLSQVVVPADGGSVTVTLKKASRKAP
jgi:hypothetical protein